jgi:hypothetical protein
MPWPWKVGLTILVVCLLASMAIATARLTTTPVEVLGDGWRGRPAEPLRGVNEGPPQRR